MDEVYAYNKARWEALVGADALFTRPWLDLDVASARARLDLDDTIADVAGKKVLCLAGGGGQQSAAFTVLGAEVSVFDISEGQLQRDQEVAQHYGVQIQTVQGDMRDLSAFAAASFDLVWHPYSLNFVPDPHPVFQEVARILRPKGIYYFMAANPFAAGIGTGDWNGAGYTVSRPYLNGEQLTYADEKWVFRDGDTSRNINHPREYRHTLSTLINGLIENKLHLLKIKEWGIEEMDLNAEPGSWSHLVTVMPPWIRFWTQHQL
jgi:ubiquinone/menaquinone biosynthesis C-methylase UbiE